LTERASFLATVQQIEWLDRARAAAGETSLSDWIRKLVVAEAEKVLGQPCPKRRPLSAPRRKK
jgi:hypothetical protein